MGVVKYMKHLASHVSSPLPGLHVDMWTQDVKCFSVLQVDFRKRLLVVVSEDYCRLIDYCSQLLFITGA